MASLTVTLEPFRLFERCGLCLGCYLAATSGEAYALMARRNEMTMDELFDQITGHTHGRGFRVFPADEPPWNGIVEVVFP